MKKLLSTGVILIMVCGILSGCGTDKDADTTTLFVEKDYSVIEVAVGAFDKDYYDEDECRDYVKDEVAAYKDEDGTGTVKFKKLSVEEGTAKLNMTYSDSKAYTEFTGEELFAGTIVEALAEGYEFDVDFSKVEDAQVKGSVPAEDVTSNSDYKVVVVNRTTDVAVHGTIQYVSDGVTMKDEGTAAVEKSEEATLSYIIYK